MKVISIPIKSHTPIRRRPSEYLSAWVKATDFPKGAYIPVNGRSNAPIVHTGTTKVEKKYNAEPGHYGPYRLCDPEEQLKWDMLEASIEVHKRPNILKKLLKKVRKYVK